MFIEFADVKTEPGLHCGVLEGFLDKPLAVVEAPVHFERVYVATDGRELLFLQLAYPSGRIKDNDVDAGAPVEGVCYGASRVARRGDQGPGSGSLPPQGTPPWRRRGTGRRSPLNAHVGP